MIHRRYLPFLSAAIGASLFSIPSVLFADTIDLSGIPDGTVVSAGNPYNGILDLTATTWSSIYNAEFPTGTNVTTSEGAIEGGVIEVFPPYLPGTDTYYSSLTATFLSPVTDVSFQLENWRTAGYTYAGVDDNGIGFTGEGSLYGALESGTSGLVWTTIDLDIPQGGYLTNFTVENRDPANANGAFWVEDISYSTVPENGTTIGFIGMALIGLAMFRRVSKQRKRLNRAPMDEPSPMGG